jgi:uncharacterized protein YbbK (DUF523 family)
MKKTSPILPAPMRPNSLASARRPPLLVSACLLGLRTRLDGGARTFPHVLQLASHFCIIPVCPEQLGGLGTPREPAELCGGAGEDALDGLAKVMTRDGREVTAQFLAGAEQTLMIARLTRATKAVLKARSPSCGVGATYDGTFSHTLREGSGVTAALLERAGIQLYTEENCRVLATGFVCAPEDV